MEEVEGLPIETVYSLIQANVMSLDEFEDWVYHRDSNEYDAGYLKGHEY